MQYVQGRLTTYAQAWTDPRWSPHIHGCQALDASTVAQCIAGKVQAPYLIVSRGGHQRRSLAAVLLALAALACRETLIAAQAKHLLVVDAGKLAKQHVVHTAILKTPPLHGHSLDAFSQTHCVHIRLRWMPPRISGQHHKTTSPALRDLGVFQHRGDGIALALWG